MQEDYYQNKDEMPSDLFDLTAEKRLLRAMLSNGDFFLLAQGKLKPSHFYDSMNKQIYKAIEKSFEKKGRVSLTSVCHELGTTYDADSEEAKSVRDLASFKTANGDTEQLSPEKFLQILEIVHELRYLRNSLREANRFFYTLLENKQQDKFSGRKLVAEHIDALYRIDEMFGADTNPKEQLSAKVSKVHLQMETGEEEPIGLRTGIRDLDQMLKGFKPGEMITFISTSGTGKSAMMLSVLYNMVFKQEKSCVYVSYEMNPKQVVNRIFKMARANDQNLDSFLSRYEDLVDTNKFRFISAVGLNIRQLHSKLLLMHRKSPLDCIFVDYINNIPASYRDTPKNERIAEVSDGLRLIARRLELPLVTAAQVDNAVLREARPPVATDIRDAEEIAEHSHKIVSIFRPSVHEIATYEFGGRHFEAEETQKLAVLTVCKNKEGSMGHCYANFNAKATYFSDWEDDRDF